MLIPGEGAIPDPVTIFIKVTSPASFQVFNIFFKQHFAAIHWHIWIFKRLADPLIHTHIQIAEYKHRGLNSFGNIKRLPAKFKAFKNIARQKNDRV